MSHKIDEETVPTLRQRKFVSDEDTGLTPQMTNSGELTQEEIEREMDSPITRRDILSLLAVVIPLALLVIIQAKLFQKSNNGIQEPNLFLDLLDQLRN